MHCDQPRSKEAEWWLHVPPYHVPCAAMHKVRLSTVYRRISTHSMYHLTPSPFWGRVPNQMMRYMSYMSYPQRSSTISSPTSIHYLPPPAHRSYIPASGSPQIPLLVTAV